MNKITILDYNRQDEAKKLKKLFSTLNSEFIIDELDQQLEELYFIRHPETLHKKPDPLLVTQFINSYYKNNKISFGKWVFYPWNNYLVHFLPEKMHTELRTARNRNLINNDEQNKFYNSNIGIAGMSVGNSAMATILYTGGAKNIKLADADILSGSNINRIRTSFRNLGKKKVHLAAEEIYEVNPYANIKLYPEGLNLSNLEDFLLKPKPINVLIEEMDNLYLKIQIRLLARKHRIPVIMAADNGDNIVLDIERYDLDPKYPLLHGDIPEEELIKIPENFSKIEAARFISRIVKPENVAGRMIESLFELGKSLYSWPQLGNAATFAGCALAYSARKIITGEPLTQGKFLLSLDEKLSPDYYTTHETEKRHKLTRMFKDMLHLE